MDDDTRSFRQQRKDRVRRNATSTELRQASARFLSASIASRYSYNFDWLGRPVIQYPQDIVAMQEIVWSVRPDLIIETGIARGGSLILSASLLALLDYCDAVRGGVLVDPRKPLRRVLGIDIDIRRHNRVAIESHPLSGLIAMVEGSSTDASVISSVRTVASQYEKVLVCLDSNHTCEHVLAELTAYAPLVSRGSYCIVFDTVIADMPADQYPDRSWTPDNCPRNAVDRYLATLAAEQTFAADGEVLRLVPDVDIDHKLLITVAPRGFLRRV